MPVNPSRVQDTKPEWAQVDLPKLCFQVSVEDERILRQRFLPTGMASLVAEDDVPVTSSGRPLLTGMFAVMNKLHAD
jgi:hypothetical protein